MTSLYAIRDAGGIRRFRTYLSREQAQAVIDREEERDPGCRAPFAVVEFVEATPLVRASGRLLAACEQIYTAVSPEAVHNAVPALAAAIDAAYGTGGQS